MITTEQKLRTYVQRILREVIEEPTNLKNDLINMRLRSSYVSLGYILNGNSTSGKAKYIIKQDKSGIVYVRGRIPIEGADSDYNYVNDIVIKVLDYAEAQKEKQVGAEASVTFEIYCDSLNVSEKQPEKYTLNSKYQGRQVRGGEVIRSAGYKHDDPVPDTNNKTNTLSRVQIYTQSKDIAHPSIKGKIAQGLPKDIRRNSLQFRQADCLFAFPPDSRLWNEFNLKEFSLPGEGGAVDVEIVTIPGSDSVTFEVKDDSKWLGTRTPVNIMAGSALGQQSGKTFCKSKKDFDPRKHVITVKELMSDFEGSGEKVDYISVVRSASGQINPVFIRCPINHNQGFNRFEAIAKSDSVEIVDFVDGLVKFDGSNGVKGLRVKKNFALLDLGSGVDGDGFPKVYALLDSAKTGTATSQKCFVNFDFAGKSTLLDASNKNKARDNVLRGLNSVRPPSVEFDNTKDVFSYVFYCLVMTEINLQDLDIYFDFEEYARSESIDRELYDNNAEPQNVYVDGKLYRLKGSNKQQTNPPHLYDYLEQQKNVFFKKSIKEIEDLNDLLYSDVSDEISDRDNISVEPDNALRGYVQLFSHRFGIPMVSDNPIAYKVLTFNKVPEIREAMLFFCLMYSGGFAKAIAKSVNNVLLTAGTTTPQTIVNKMNDGYHALKSIVNDTIARSIIGKVAKVQAVDQRLTDLLVSITMGQSFDNGRHNEIMPLTWNEISKALDTFIFDDANSSNKFSKGSHEKYINESVRIQQSPFSAAWRNFMNNLKAAFNGTSQPNRSLYAMEPRNSNFKRLTLADKINGLDKINGFPGMIVPNEGKNSILSPNSKKTASGYNPFALNADPKSIIYTIKKI